MVNRNRSIFFNFNKVINIAIRGFPMQFALNCIRLPLAIAILLQATGRYPCGFSRFCMRLLTLLQSANRNVIPFRVETKKGQVTVTLSNNVTWELVYAWFLREAILYFMDLCNKIRKILEVQKESFVWIKVPAPKLPAEFANCMQIRACFAIPLGELKIKFKNGCSI